MWKFLSELKTLILRDYAFVTLVFALVVTILVGLLTNFVAIYTSRGLNSQIFQFSGVFLGLILTAYAIFITLFNFTEKKVIGTDAFARINTAFVFELVLTIFITIISLLLFFLNEQLILPVIIYFQFWLLLVIISWALFLVTIFYALFDNIRSYMVDD